MRTPQTSIEELMKDPKVRGLKPHTLKAYVFFINKANGEVISKFSIRKQALEWESLPELKLTANKNTVSELIKELEEANLIRVDFERKTLTIL